MKRFFIILLLVFLSCEQDDNIYIEEKCDCRIDEYVVNDVQTVLVGSRNVKVDCDLDNTIFGELYDNNDNLVGYKRYICPNQ